MLEENPPTCSASTIGLPCIDPWFLHANPALAGKSAVDVYQAVVAALKQQGIMVILDDHTTDAEFCCAAYSGSNGLWWGGQLWDDHFGTGLSWMKRQGWFQSDWHQMVGLMSSYSNVIGADLRNEPSGAYGITAQWSGQGKKKNRTPENWQEGASEAAAVVLATNRNLLIMVEGVKSGSDLSYFYQKNKITLSVDNRLVWSPHAYSNFTAGIPQGASCSTPTSDHKNSDPTNYGCLSSADLAIALGHAWGFLLTQGQPNTAPVWVGEFGTCDTSSSCVLAGTENGNFSTYFTQYLHSNDADWAWWALNGTVSNGGANLCFNGADQNCYDNTTRTFKIANFRPWFMPETYGILDPQWTNAESAPLLGDLQNIQQPTQFP